jgi:hypothetical protein
VSFIRRTLKRPILANSDIIVLPETQASSSLMTGKPGTREARPSMSNYPPEFQKGMGKKGLEKLADVCK